MTSKQELLKQVEESSLRENPLHFDVGDTVDVHTRILEGDKERVQVFSGIVIARRGGGTRETFTVRRIVAGEGVERTFPVHSPKIAKLEIKRHGKTRRSKLFYLRDRVGKRTRLAERRVIVPGTSAPENEAIVDDVPVAVEEASEEVAQEAASEESAE
ncbi:MAG TPA: 50S ribosomal protein L19 [Planctomycetaceae bacterium]|nr:50S ribosomal protein L19 [Planctomycetaceae bacterium]|tara:strand:- start:136 stop:609 length:474 start_codon:yes stop_codon:yes gene_type:complete